jgi:prepilin-type N-terminal cleavage/methylation domain-containing protein
MKLFYRLTKRIQDHKGFTLLETAIALGISSLVAVSVVTTIYQLQSISNSHYAHVVAVKQVENAIHYINRDVQMAQTVTPQGAQGFPLILNWVSWDNGDTNTVTYSLQSGKLMRQSQLNEDTPTSSAVAQFISAASSDSYSIYDPANHKLTVQVTSTVISGNKQDSETRKIPIIPRPGS